MRLGLMQTITIVEDHCLHVMNLWILQTFTDVSEELAASVFGAEETLVTDYILEYSNFHSHLREGVESSYPICQIFALRVPNRFGFEITYYSL
jgi:hypothetical protein